MPEGAENIKVDIPFEVDSIEHTKTFSILDIQGRPTLIIKKKHVGEFHY